jgi:hypothetical protein
MFTSEQLRASAAKFGDLIKNAEGSDAVRELQRQERSLTALADNEDWMAANSSKTVPATDLADRQEPPTAKADGTLPPTSNDGDESYLGAEHALAKEEQHVLGCLGAAVIMQWNTLPMKLQKELFEGASSVGNLLQSGALKRQIACFLHNHKDDAAPGA